MFATLQYIKQGPSLPENSEGTDFVWYAYYYAYNTNI